METVGEKTEQEKNWYETNRVSGEKRKKTKEYESVRERWERGREKERGRERRRIEVLRLHSPA